MQRGAKSLRGTTSGQGPKPAARRLRFTNGFATEAAGARLFTTHRGHVRGAAGDAANAGENGGVNCVHNQLEQYVNSPCYANQVVSTGFVIFLRCARHARHARHGGRGRGVACPTEVHPYSVLRTSHS